MRHLWSLLIGILMAPLAWLLLALGQPGVEQRAANWFEAGRFDTSELIGPVVLLVVSGTLLGLLGTLRWSPLGPVVAGLLLVAPTVLLFIDPLRTLDAFSYDQPRRLLGQELAPAAPVSNGTLLVLGTLLLMAVFSADRWHRREPRPALVTPTTSATHPPVSGPRVGAHITVADRGETPRAMPMSDEEILVAAAQLDENPTADLPALPDQTESTPAEPDDPDNEHQR
jgi:hypothetical protein